MRRQTLLPSALGHLGAMGSRLRPAGTAVIPEFIVITKRAD
jgi:hypothetical protein